MQVKAMRKFPQALLCEQATKLPYNCLMVTFALPKWEWFVSKVIDPNDYEPQKWMEGKAVYEEPHVTVCYGLLPQITVEDVRPLLIPLEEIDVEFKAINYFESQEFDVVKFECSSKQLTALNQVVKTLPHKEFHRDYHVHATIAYVKPGMGKKYVNKITPFTLKPDGYLFSSADGATVGFIV